VLRSKGDCEMKMIEQASFELHDGRYGAVNGYFTSTGQTWDAAVFVVIERRVAISRAFHGESAADNARAAFVDECMTWRATPPRQIA
jgi:hypothetical protein